MAEFNFQSPDAFGAPPANNVYNFTMPSSDGDDPPIAQQVEVPVLTTISASVNQQDLTDQINTLYRKAEAVNETINSLGTQANSQLAAGDTAGYAATQAQIDAQTRIAEGYEKDAANLKRQGGTVLFTLDANLNEIVEYESDVTQYAVEDGSPVSDNISIKSVGLSIDGVVTNMSMTKGNSNNVGRAKLALAKSVLEGIYQARQVVTITSGLSVYLSMAIKNIRITRSSGKGELGVSLRLVQIRKVMLKTTAANFAPGKTAGKGGATKAKVTNQDDTPDTTKEAKGTTILGALKNKLFH